MIDWMTLYYPGEKLPANIRQVFHSMQGRVMQIAPDGSIDWETPTRINIRSDSHQITVSLGTRLCIQGSPARVMGFDNVFGSDSPVECFHAMLRFVQQQASVILDNNIEHWHLSRMDITFNYCLDDRKTVLEALEFFGKNIGGRYRVQNRGSTVYWSPGSSKRSGKAYAKGDHLRYMQKKKENRNNQISELQLNLADSLLRLELKLGNEYWSRFADKKWHLHTESDLSKIHYRYFKQFIGEEIEVIDMKGNDILLNQLLHVAPTEGQARSALLFWSFIREVGIERAKQLTPNRTFYRNKKLLKLAGLVDADFTFRQVVPFQRRAINLGNPVTSWNELKLKHASGGN